MRLRIAWPLSRRILAGAMNSSPALTSAFVFKKAGWKETTVLMAVAWLVPFAVHLAPWSGVRPLGAYLLPMFWATFVAVYLYGMSLGLAGALFAVAANVALTGQPAGRYLAELGFELLVFVGLTTWLVRRWPRLVLIAPLGFLGAKAGWVTIQLATGAFGAAGSAADALLQSCATGFAGLVVLAGIDVALVWFYPKSPRRAR
jgi:hypothetical protein